MKEKLKEFALFGNFNSIDYTVANNISVQLKEYDFRLNGFNEMVQTPISPLAADLTSENVLQGAILTPQPRPALLADDGKLRITFGVSRINIDSTIDSIEDTAKFIDLVKRVANNILSLAMFR